MATTMLMDFRRAMHSNAFEMHRHREIPIGTSKSCAVWRKNRVSSVKSHSFAAVDTYGHCAVNVSMDCAENSDSNMDSITGCAGSSGLNLDSNTGCAVDADFDSDNNAVNLDSSLYRSAENELFSH